jgi:hypothetical protein
MRTMLVCGAVVFGTSRICSLPSHQRVSVGIYAATATGQPYQSKQEEAMVWCLPPMAVGVAVATVPLAQYDPPSAHIRPAWV